MLCSNTLSTPTRTLQQLTPATQQLTPKPHKTRPIHHALLQVHHYSKHYQQWPLIGRPVNLLPGLETAFSGETAGLSTCPQPHTETEHAPVIARTARTVAPVTCTRLGFQAAGPSYLGKTLVVHWKPQRCADTRGAQVATRTYAGTEAKPDHSTVPAKGSTTAKGLQSGCVQLNCTTANSRPRSFPSHRTCLPNHLSLPSKHHHD
jgi:hypothetical protein